MGKVKNSKKKALPKVRLRQVEVSSGGNEDNGGIHLDETSERGEVASGAGENTAQDAVANEETHLEEASEMGEAASGAVDEESLQVLIDRKSSADDGSRQLLVHHDSLESTEKQAALLRRTSTPFIPEAFLVESFGEEAGSGEQPLYIGTAVEDVPWWRLKQTKLLVVCLLCVVPITLIAGVFLGSGYGASPKCNVGDPSKIGDGICDGGGYNTEECDWDGGDCEEFNEKYPDCHVDKPERIGDGFCQGKEYRTEECGWDGGDCKEVDGYPGCHVGRPSKIGDGNCDGGGYNSEECGWDGGDCL